MEANQADGDNNMEVYGNNGIGGFQNGGLGFALLPSHGKEAAEGFIPVYMSENMVGHPDRVWMENIDRQDVESDEWLELWVQMVAHTNDVTAEWENRIIHFEGFFDEGLWRMPTDGVAFVHLIDMVTIYRG